uniref:Uncharacterized protein n=2 Tax=Avena sativa TaxID=4498 RepID=A0ACD5V9I7_AVESA
MDLANAIGVIGAVNECVNFFQWAKSAISSLQSRWSGPQERDIEDHVLHLQSGLWHLKDSLPAMYNLIDGAEWRSHEHCVAELLPKLKDAVYDADDLLDEFRWYEMKVELEGNASKSHFTDFFATVIQGNSNKLNDIQGRLDHLSSQLEKMGLHGVAPRFDKSVRPETSSLPNETKIFGRDNDLKLVIGSLGVPTNSKRKRATSSVIASTRTSLGNTVSNESRIQSLSVLPIVGIGGVGKTTLAQHICSHKEVKSHFELRIWICVSDDFDVKRLTKEVIQSCTGKKATVDNLDSLQHALSNHVKNKRILIVLDDMWDDALKENGDCWKRFCAPLKSAQEGSMMLVTTRCPKVVEGVRTMKPVILEGLKDNDFWEFFRLCAFGSESSNNDPELERIGRCILPKLKGSPLAAKTLGRILRMNLQESRWNRILESELWKLPQEATEILPALRLSYMYLPFRLKQCFSFCAVFPKDYKFRKEDLAEIWVAEGFVEPQGDHPIQDIGCQYFEDLVARSFFQKVTGGYVIHDLLHDMAQKVSEHACFILRNKNDFDKVPLNVRHIFIHPSSDFDNSNLLSLCKHTKLRTLICKKQSGNKRSSVMDNWCTKLPRIRVMCCASTNELPDGIGNLKHLRYLKITKGRPLSIPPTFCQLYNLQILDVKTCKIESLPDGFSNLSNLKRFVSQGFSYNPVSVCIIDADEHVGVRLIENLNQFSEHLVMSNVGDQPEAKLKNKKYLYKLTLNWPGPSMSQIIQHNAVEVRPPKSFRSLLIQNYQGFSLPRWINGSIGIFVSLTDMDISGCQYLSSLEHFLHPDYVPTIKKIQLQNCNCLVSVPTERFGDLCFLEELEVRGCPNIRSLSLVSPSLRQLRVGDCGNLLDNIDCPSLKRFHIGSGLVTCIMPQMWSLPALQVLEFLFCLSLTSIGASTTLSLFEGTCSIRALSSFPSLEHLSISTCPLLEWQRGLVLPSSLKTLELCNCGDFYAYVPGCLENLTSLVLLKMGGCKGLTSIPGTIWRSKLASLEELVIFYCSNLVSIGGAEAVAKIKKVQIIDCPKLKEAEQIMRRG